jgi:hypothetical protein
VISENDSCNFTSKNAKRNSEAYGQASMWRSVLRSRDVSLLSLLNSQTNKKNPASELAADFAHHVDYFRNHHGGGFLKVTMV